MSEFDILKLCKRVDGQYKVDPAVLFPAMVARIKACVAGELPVELLAKGWTGNPRREPVADGFLRQAEGFPAEAWELALEPYDANMAPQLAALRRAALEFAESWFKRALALRVGPPVMVHIGKNLAYRR
jgi:hypothetical protein